MKSRRAKNKLMLGAWVDMRLVAAVDLWVKAHPRSTRSDFVVEAVVAMLKTHGIVVPEEAVSELRQRKPLKPEAFEGVGFGSESKLVLAALASDATAIKSMGTPEERDNFVKTAIDLQRFLNAFLSAYRQERNKPANRPVHSKTK